MISEQPTVGTADSPAHNGRHAKRCIVRFIAEWPVWVEASVVLGVGCGLSIVFQLWRGVQGKHYVFSDALLIKGSIVELITIGVALWIGHFRGWSLKIFGSRVTWKGTIGGLGLHVLTLATGVATYFALQKIHPCPSNYTSVPMSFPVVLIASIVNPLSEELLETGYVVYRLQRFGPWVAIVASSIVRASVHVYQGINGAIELFVFGVVMASVYWRWRQLWPLVLAHGIGNFIGFITV